MGAGAANGDRYEDAIRAALGDANVLRAVHEGYQAMRAAIVERLKHQPSEAMLIGAHVAAEFYRISLAIPDLAADRPPRCPKVPRPDDLLAVFDAGITGDEGGTW